MKKIHQTILLLTLAATARVPADNAATQGGNMGVFTDLRDDASAPLINDLGLGWVRLMYQWTWIEEPRGTFNWKEFDRWMARAKARNLKVLVVAQGSPAWANGGHGPYDEQSGLKTPPLPRYDEAFANYVEGLVRHGADAIEVWNEPNGAFWQPSPDPKRWAHLVTLAYDAVKAVDPKIPVITGGVCPLPEGSVNVHSPENFIKAALEGVPELAGKFDGLGVHPYVFADDPTAKDPLTAPYRWNPILQSETIHKTLALHQAEKKPLWFTEFGVPTGGPFGAVTPEQSGVIYQHYFAAFDRLAAKGVPLGPVFFWTLHDIPLYQEANAIEGWQGIYDLQGKPKASVKVIKSRAAEALR